jgi:hemoglobin
MKKDIQNIADIKLLIDRFYERVVQDPMIGFIFTETFKVNWAKHLPVMYSFWENTLFFTGNYAGNPMMIHRRIHERVHLVPEQFDRWVTLFCATADHLFEGEKTELAKQRAQSIATIMKIKIL